MEEEIRNYFDTCSKKV